MPEPEAQAVRAIFLLCFHCGTCDRQWYTPRPFTSENASQIDAVLKNPHRGFKLVLCEPCWDKGNRDQSVQFWFVEHPVH